MKKPLSVLTVATSLLFAVSAIAADRVVVVPLGGAVGDAVATDVVMGKTFSSKAGKGLTGKLDLKVGKIYTNSIGMDFSLIPAGSFVMGSPDGNGTVPVWPAEVPRLTSEKQHVVTLTKSFYMQTTEVTQAQWQQVIGSNPSYFTACGLDCPVESISWNNVHNFIDALNSSEGRINCNTTPNTCYFLPAEAQWEYAARGGTVTAFYSGGIINAYCKPLDPNLDAIGWYCGNSSYIPHPVAQKIPNNWGLYDISGNILEWCEDWYGTYPAGPVTDPSGAASGSGRVIRGGDFADPAYIERSASRFSRDPGSSSKDIGFRLALPISQ